MHSVYMAKKKHPANEGFDEHAYAMDLAKNLLEEMFKIIHGEDKAHGEQVGEKVLYTFLGSMISTMVYNALGQAEDEDEANRRYFKVKRDIEAVIAQGFEKAFSILNPDSLPDFQCDIMALDDGKIPDPEKLN